MKLSNGLKIAIVAATAGTLCAATAHAQGGQTSPSRGGVTRPDSQGKQEPKELPSIVEIAESDAELSTLLEAVKTAELADALGEAESLTVFAPTNEAFAALDRDALAGILADKERLQKILLHHATPAKLYRNTIAAVTGARMLDGSVTSFTKAGDEAWTIDGAMIMKSYKAKNAIIYKIDKVLVPME